MGKIEDRVPKPLKTIYRYAKALTGFHDYLEIEHDGKKLYDMNFSQSKTLGHIDTDVVPYRRYSFNPELDRRASHSRYDKCDDMITLNFGTWFWSSEDFIVQDLVQTELHELTHWACEGQGYEPESSGDNHTRRWSKVLQPLAEEYLDDVAK